VKRLDGCDIAEVVSIDYCMTEVDDEDHALYFAELFYLFGLSELGAGGNKAKDW
jgi:hypothetical protein